MDGGTQLNFIKSSQILILIFIKRINFSLPNAPPHKPISPDILLLLILYNILYIYLFICCGCCVVIDSGFLLGETSGRTQAAKLGGGHLRTDPVSDNNVKAPSRNADCHVSSASICSKYFSGTPPRPSDCKGWSGHRCLEGTVGLPPTATMCCWRL